MAHGSSQARGWMGAAADGLRQSHSNSRSELCLWPTPQLTATLDPSCPAWGQTRNLHPHGYQSSSLLLSHDRNSNSDIFTVSSSQCESQHLLKVRVSSFNHAFPLSPSTPPYDWSGTFIVGGCSHNAFSQQLLLTRQVQPFPWWARSTERLWKQSWKLSLAWPMQWS